MADSEVAGGAFSALDALTSALDDDDKQSTGEPAQEPVRAQEESEGDAAEPAGQEAAANEEEPETVDDGLIELPLTHPDGSPIRATVDELKQWRENGLRQADYSRSMNELREQSERAQSEARSRVEQETQRYTEQLQMLQAAVLASVSPELRNVDWTLLAAQNPQEYVRLRARAEQVQGTLQQIEGLHKQSVEKRNAEMQEAQQKAARAAAEELQRDIPSWSQELYGDLMRYAVENGYAEDEVLNATDAKAFKILWKARQYDQLQKAKPGVQSKLQALPKVIKPGTQASKTQGKAGKANDAFAAHKKAGSVKSLATFLNAIEN